MSDGFGQQQILHGAYTAMCGQATICAALLRKFTAFRVPQEIAINESNFAASQLQVL